MVNIENQRQNQTFADSNIGNFVKVWNLFVKRQQKTIQYNEWYYHSSCLKDFFLSQTAVISCDRLSLIKTYRNIQKAWQQAWELECLVLLQKATIKCFS